jgi:hypothetical protein
MIARRLLEERRCFVDNDAIVCLGGSSWRERGVTVVLQHMYWSHPDARKLKLERRGVVLDTTSEGLDSLFVPIVTKFVPIVTKYT